MRKLMFYGMAGLALCLPIVLKAQKTVDEYVELAVENNPGLKAKFTAYYESLERVPQVGALPDPSVGLGAYILPVETRVGSRVLDLEISQSFPWFGTLAAQKDEASQWAKVKFREFQVTKTELLFDVKSLYYDIHSLNSSINTQNKFLKILNKQEQELLTKVEAAIASLADVLLIQMKQKETQVELEGLMDYKNTLSSKMNALLGSDPLDQVLTSDKLDAITLSQDETTFIDNIINHNPDIKLLNETTLALESQKKVAHLARSPSFNAGLSYGLIQRRSDVEIPNNGRDVLMPRVSMSIPLNRKKYNAKVKEVELKQERVALEILDLKNTLNFQFAEANNQYHDAQRSFGLYQDLIAKAKQALKILTISYSTDLKRYTEILEMQKLLLTYELEIEKAKSNQHIAVAKIEKLMAKGI